MAARKRKTVPRNRILQGEALHVLETFPDESVDCVVTSPPYYGLRDYGVKGQIGLEPTLAAYVDRLLAVTAELKRVLKRTGTLWWNHGDSYYNASKWTYKKTGHSWNRERELIPRGRRQGKAGQMPEKCQTLQAHRLAARMIDEQGWILRNQIIWWKPNCMPSSAKDRFTVDFEPVFFFARSKRYWFEQQFEPQHQGGREGTTHRNSEGWLGRSKRTVWRISTQPFPEAHFAVFPEALCEIPIRAGCPPMICRKCGVARERVYEGASSRAFKTGVRDAKKGRRRHSDRKASKSEVENCEEGRTHAGEAREFKDYTDCGCGAGWQRGIVLDPFMGAGTVAKVARELGRHYVGIELNSRYIKIAERRLAKATKEARRDPSQRRSRSVRRANRST